MMRHHRSGLRHRGPARAGLCALRTAAAAAMLLGTMTVGMQAAGAQADEDAGTYESPTYGYTLEWDADLWTVDSDSEASADYPRDLLNLTDVDTTTTLFVEASDEDWSDTDDCVETLFAEIGLDPTDGEAIEDEDGEPFEISEDGRSLAAYIFPIEVDGDTQDQVRLVECVGDEDSDLIVGFTVYSGIVDDYVADGYPLVEDIAGSLAFAGGNVDDPTPRPNRDATPEGSDHPEPSDRSGGTSGVDGSAYVSPTYGYELEWDEDVWTVEDESSEDDVDSLMLSSDIMLANVTGYNSGDGAVETCLANYLTVLSDRGDGNAIVAVNPDTDEELVSLNDDGTQLTGFLIYSIDGENYSSLITCVSLGDENILGVEFTAPGVEITTDEASAQISDILDTLAF